MIDALKQEILTALHQAIQARYGDVELPSLSLALPPDAAMGDFTFGVFPLARPLRKGPPIIARELAEGLKSPLLSGVEAVGPYLNLTVDPAVLFERVIGAVSDPAQPFGTSQVAAGRRVMIEFASPNTNKPLHIGHVRNIVLGDSVSHLLSAAGYDVVRACLMNDRSSAICKSMLAYQRFFPEQTPASRGQKGDHFVGDCYVAYAQAYKQEVDALQASFVAEGVPLQEAKKRAEAESPLDREVREMLRKWEAGDPEVRAVWEQMNGWVYEGFHATWQRLGIVFDRFYYESELYLKGRQLVLDALEQGLVERRSDGSIFVDLSDEGMDPKVLLRSDGTSLYITQDLGVALQKYEDYQIERSIHVVGNEQDQQLRAVFATLKRMGYGWADGLYHLSYGMVNLPAGRMKSREGTVVDADDLLEEMEFRALEKALEARSQDPRREADGLSEAALAARARAVALGAIKFYMLRINPRKDFVFNPEESIQLQGDTGPYVQYTHARICSVRRKAAAEGIGLESLSAEGGFKHLGNLEERAVARLLIDFPRVVADAAERLMPSHVATYLVELAGAFNKFYHDHSVLGAPDRGTMLGRLALSEATGRVLAKGLELLGIEAPEAM